MRYDEGRLRATGHDHVIFDGVDLNDHFEIVAVSTSAYPAVEAVTATVPGMAGLHYYSRSVGAREVTLTLRAVADAPDPFDVIRRWRELSPLLAHDEPRRLYLDDEWYLNAMLTGETPIEFAGDRGSVEVAFTAFDPRFHGRTHEVELTAGDNTFFVVSHTDVWPVITVTGASPPLSVKNTATEDEVRIPTVGGLPVRILMEDMRCYSGSNYVPVDIQYTDFYSLPANQEATIRLSSGTGTLTYEELAL